MRIDRQAAQAQNLQIPPRPDADMTRFEVLPKEGDRLLVLREWAPRHAPSLVYCQIVILGPRGRDALDENAKPITDQPEENEK